MIPYIDQKVSYSELLSFLGKMDARIGNIEHCLFNYKRKTNEEVSNYINTGTFERKYKFLSHESVRRIVKDSRYPGSKIIDSGHLKLCEYDFIKFMETGKCWMKKIQNNYNLLKDSIPEIIEAKEKIKKSKESIQPQHTQL